MTFEINRLSDSFVAEIRGVDLSLDIDDGLFAAIHDAFIAHQVLVFRDQQIEPHHQTAFSARFGPLEKLYADDQRVSDFPEIAILSNEQVDGKFIGVVAAGDYWHSDLSYRAETSLATFLFAHKLPTQGGDTQFADLYKAYETLSVDLKRRIDGLSGLHQVSKLVNPRVEVTREGGADYYRKRGTEETAHPIVRTHPVSGRKLLYLSPRFTVGIADMDDEEAQPLLDILFDHQIREAHVYQHKWTLGDFVMWDNRCINHRAAGGYAMDDIRLLHRTSTRGDQPFA
ncbi:MAG: TauD/TfdA family dioxygenase [Rhodospirillaceae bacterium]|jgi:taurine dioxygenase|nr:TauD/TfdA family dioxygenase [Rhodospirillaceae bacterium]MBT5455054.1 TauD/TfdA family dioxygenase [Rhodospirillaceae bacterium]